MSAGRRSTLANHQKVLPYFYDAVRIFAVYKNFKKNKKNTETETTSSHPLMVLLCSQPICGAH